MINPVTTATPAEPTAIPTAAGPTAQAAAATAEQIQPQQPSTRGTPTDTVHISNAAKKALEEATETQAQTVREAQNGDTQAQRLLAKEEATRKLQH